ncbi:unnamed protein product [Lampetra fluviatilis]
MHRSMGLAPPSATTTRSTTTGTRSPRGSRASWQRTPSCCPSHRSDPPTRAARAPAADRTPRRPTGTGEEEPDAKEGLLHGLHLPRSRMDLSGLLPVVRQGGRVHVRLGRCHDEPAGQHGLPHPHRVQRGRIRLQLEQRQNVAQDAFPQRGLLVHRHRPQPATSTPAGALEARHLTRVRRLTAALASSPRWSRAPWPTSSARASPPSRRTCRCTRTRRCCCSPTPTPNTLPPNHAELQSLSKKAVSALQGLYNTRYTYGSSATTIYIASGGSDDWAYDVGVKYSFTLELRDTGRYGFLLPESQIKATCEETMLAVKVIAEYVLANAK